MPLFFIGSGLVLILTGIKGDPSKLWTLVTGEFSGPNNFVYWLLSILILGSLGYVESLKSVSRLFIALVVIVLLLDNRGFFAQFQSFVNSSQNPKPATAGS